MTAGSVGMRPGKHEDLGVRLEGLPVPEVEGAGEEEEPKRSGFEAFGEPETPVARRRRRLKSWDKRQAGTPAVGLGFDAVIPEVGWWIYQVGEEEPEKKQGHDAHNLDWESHEALVEEQVKKLMKEMPADNGK